MDNPTRTNHRVSAESSLSVLNALRTLMPNRAMYFQEALRVAERQAARLLQLRHSGDVPVTTAAVSGLPRLVIEHDPDLPAHAASGASDWDTHRRCWVIALNPDEPQLRQRFTVFHEYKHIVDHGHAGLTGWLPRTVYGLDPVEYIAEYFAGCVLMPALSVKAAFYDGIQHPSELAAAFDVFSRAMQVRLSQLGLTSTSDLPARRAGPRYRPQPNRHRYTRPRSASSLTQSPKEFAA